MMLVETPTNTKRGHAVVVEMRSPVRGIYTQAPSQDKTASFLEQPAGKKGVVVQILRDGEKESSRRDTDILNVAGRPRACGSKGGFSCLKSKMASIFTSKTQE